MALYSTRRREWVSRGPRRIVVEPNPYDPGTPGYAERNRETVTKGPGGITRIDLGEPI